MSHLVAQALGVGDTPGIDWIKHAIQVGIAAGVAVLHINSRGERWAS